MVNNQGFLAVDECNKVNKIVGVSVENDEILSETSNKVSKTLPWYHMSLLPGLAKTKRLYSK